MMGQWQKQTELWVEPVHLGERIPQDNLLRNINRILDLSFVRSEVARFYGSNGNVSVDPVIIVKLMLLLFLDDVRSERELMRIVPLRLDCLWFLGYGLEDEVPNHSVLSKARKRWGTEVFERFFAQSVERCIRNLGVQEYPTGSTDLEGVIFLVAHDLPNNTRSGHALATSSELSACF